MTTDRDVRHPLPAPRGVGLTEPPEFVDEASTAKIDLIDDPIQRADARAAKTDRTATATAGAVGGLEQQLKLYAEQDKIDHAALHTKIDEGLDGVRGELVQVRGDISTLSSHVIRALDRTAEEAHVRTVSKLTLETGTQTGRQGVWWGIAKAVSVAAATGLIALITHFAEHC